MTYRLQYIKLSESFNLHSHRGLSEKEKRAVLAINYVELSLIDLLFVVYRSAAYIIEKKSQRERER